MVVRQAEVVGAYRIPEYVCAFTFNNGAFRCAPYKEDAKIVVEGGGEISN